MNLTQSAYLPTTMVQFQVFCSNLSDFENKINLLNCFNCFWHTLVKDFPYCKKLLSNKKAYAFIKRDIRKLRIMPTPTLFEQATTWGYRPPSKKHDPGKIPGTRTMCSPNFGKKWGNPPRRMVQRGGFVHFFSDFGDRVGWVPGIFLKN